MKLKILLLEGPHLSAKHKFEEEGHDVHYYTGTMNEQELIEEIKDVHIIGIRSRTHLTEKVLKNAKVLIAIGCFCIGTNQVNLKEAELLGIPVFNSPFSNSRSVAELIIAQTINLSRRLGDANNEMHSGKWIKSSNNRNEVRGKTFGIIGYGNIGFQTGVLAEALGMNVIYYDIVSKLSVGNAKCVPSLICLLKESDFVSLHVPETNETKNMISGNEMKEMKKGAMLLNASRGTVVNLHDLMKYLKNGHLGGVYLDVYPAEPNTKKTTFVIPHGIDSFPNVMMTPHIGGSTLQAQTSISSDVTHKLIKYIKDGSTNTSLNFPQLSSSLTNNTYRVVNVHKNNPGVLSKINNILSNHNITKQLLGTTESIGYLIIDVDATNRANNDLLGIIGGLENSIKTRIVN